MVYDVKTKKQEERHQNLPPKPGKYASAEEKRLFKNARNLFYYHKYKEKNKVKRRESSRKYYYQNKEKCLAYQRKHKAKPKSKEVRHQAYLRRKANGNYYESNEYARKQRKKHKTEINNYQQKRRRNPKVKQYDKMVCDARRHIGVSPAKMTIEEKKALLYHRLVRLVEGRTITKEEARGIIDRFEKKLDEALLNTYQYRVRPNSLGRVLYVTKHYAQ